MIADLPESEIAEGMTFGALASCIRDFFEWQQKSGKQVAEDALNHLEVLLKVLELKIQPIQEFLEPVPATPIEPPPPRPSANAREASAGWRKHFKNLARHRLSIDEWRRDMANWQLRRQAAENCRKSIESERRILENRRKDLDELIARGGLPIIDLGWYILPPGFWPHSTAQVNRLFSPLNTDTHRPERLVHAQEINPFEVGRGRGEFERYLCFRYRFTSRVLLESADDGNAAYILLGDWRTLSRLSKHELLTRYDSEIIRIIHREDSHWRSHIFKALQE